MRRVIIIRKDLHLKPGKLAAMCMHLAEAYWANLLKSGSIKDNEFEWLLAMDNCNREDGKPVPVIYKRSDLCEAAKKAFDEGKEWFAFKTENSRPTFSISIEVPKDIWDEYVNGIFTKTICEAKNLNNLKTKIEPVVQELGLTEGIDWGYINDRCLTDLTPENEDGTCTVGAWFKPLKDEDAFKISKKFKLYRDDGQS